ncbi:MAG: stage V sporulation protein AA [Lachnospiraceae bacterium]|nr:stage V sporulation protein AA [Lachnospiraceae bacterium]
MSGGNSSGSKQVYLKVNQITEVQKQDVFLKDIGKVSCQDPVLQNKCSCIKVKTIRENQEKRYVEDVMDIIEKIQQLDSNAQVDNLGEIDYIIDYLPPKRPKLAWQWIKTIFVCIISFCGAAFAIMTFNNDASVMSLFQELYQLVMGKEPSGFTILEASYSIGLAVGIIIFFNHFAKWKLNTDPTPIEVQMRTYEEDICKTLIENNGRKEKEVDVT